MPVKASSPRCTVHPARPAGWACGVCARSLCAGCAVEVQVAPLTSYVRCGPCGGQVEVLTRPGSEVSFTRLLREPTRLPLTLPRLLAVVALAVAAGLLDTASEPMRRALLLVWSVVAWLLGVFIFRACAEDRVQAEPLSELLQPALGAAALTAPALLVPRSGLFGAALVCAGSLVLTPLLAGVLSRSSPRAALFPVQAAKELLLLGRDGALAVVLTTGIWLFAWMLGALRTAAGHDLPPAGMLAALSLFLVPWVLGLLAQARGEELGYRFRERGRVPALRGVRPERTEAYRPPEPPSGPVREPIEIGGEARPLEIRPFAEDDSGDE
ncbi:MAG TPA: hypothetical protein VK454_04340 [Myxococcaceae bacterium]|nr:hypothetical protein [Myxococcaceae bacterium]